MQFFTRGHVAPDTEPVAAPGGNHQRLPALLRVVRAPAIQQARQLGHVAALGIAADNRAGQLTQQIIALGCRGDVAAQYQVCTQTSLCCGECGCPAVIALQTTAGDERVVTLGKGMSDDKFQLANLVAAEQTARQVVALHPQPVSATPALSGTGQILQWRGALGQRNPLWQRQPTHQPMDLSVPLGNTAWTCMRWNFISTLLATLSTT